MNLLKPCLLCPFDNFRRVPRNFRKTVRPKKCHQKAIEVASAIFQSYGFLFQLFSVSVLAPRTLLDKRMKMLDTFYIFKDTIAVSKAKLI